MTPRPEKHEKVVRLGRISNVLGSKGARECGAIRRYQGVKIPIDPNIIGNGKRKDKLTLNKKDIAEIKKQFKPANCTITRICGCYVDFEKEKKFTSKKALFSLSEDETFKYLDIFRYTLSGTLGKNLLHMEFPLEQEEPGGTQEFLLRLKNSKLEDDTLLNLFYDKVIENYTYIENYYIVLAHAIYDVPGKASDELEMFDASDNIYEYILCSICPVNLSKAGLSYSLEKNDMEDRIRDWIVEAPMKGFLFPSFQDRGADIHQVLYYTKKPDELMPEFIEAVLSSNLPIGAAEQKESFQSLIMDSLGEDCSYEAVKGIHEHLYDLIEEHKEDVEPLEISAPEVKRILLDSGVSEEKAEVFEQAYSETVGENKPLLAANIAETKKFQLQTPNVVIKVNSDRTDLIEKRRIDGRQCIVIAIDEYVEVNGIMVQSKGESQDVL